MALAFLRLRQVLYDRELWRRLCSLEGPPAAHADDSPASVFFPMETEDTDQGRFEDRFHGATFEPSESEAASSDAMEEVALEPLEHTAEAIAAGEAWRVEMAADDPLLLSAPTPELPVLMTIERKLTRLWARLPRGRAISHEVARALNSGCFLYVEYEGVIYGLDPNILDYGDESEGATDGDVEA